MLARHRCESNSLESLHLHLYDYVRVAFFRIASGGVATPASMPPQVSPAGAVIATVAAVVANLFESYLGAASQGRLDWLTNDAVNAIQIALAAAIAVALQQLW